MNLSWSRDPLFSRMYQKKDGKDFQELTYSSNQKKSYQDSDFFIQAIYFATYERRRIRSVSG